METEQTNGILILMAIPFQLLLPDPLLLLPLSLQLCSLLLTVTVTIEMCNFASLNSYLITNQYLLSQLVPH